MKRRVFIAVLGGFALLACASPAFGQQSGEKDPRATISLSGRGDGPIEVRDAEGKLLQILSPADVKLNQPPAHVVERERAYREKRRKEAAATHERRKEERRITAEKATELARVAEEQRIASEEGAARITAAQGEKPKNPYRVRRKTVRRKIVDPEAGATGTAPTQARR